MPEQDHTPRVLSDEILRRFLGGESVGSIKAFGVQAAEGAIVDAQYIENVIRDYARSRDNCAEMLDVLHGWLATANVYMPRELIDRTERIVAKAEGSS